MKQVVKYISGMALMTLGIALIIQSQIGASPWDSVSNGLSQLTPLSMGVWTFLTGIFLVLLIAIITKTKPNYLSIIAGLITGVLIDLWLDVIASHEVGIIFGLIGIVVFAFGIALYTQTTLPVNPIDNFMMTLVNEKNLNVSIAKIITDGLGLIIGLLVHGPIGLGTLVIYFTLSPLIGIFSKYTSKI